MTVQKFTYRGSPKGEVFLPGDKSISHRAIIIGGVSDGKLRIKNFSWGKDNLSTWKAMENLGVKIWSEGEEVIVEGRGLDGLSEPSDVLDAGNSGTTIRLLTGLLSAQEFYSVITGDRFLRKRPMGRVVNPLRKRGASIWGRKGGELAPLSILGRKLGEFTFFMDVPSAQVKSAILLSGLNATGPTKVVERAPTRDHTERMLKYFGADIKFRYPEVLLSPGKELRPVDLTIPGDLSSAAFFIVLALILEDSEIVIRDVLLNPTRTGIIEVLRKMGANIEVINYSEEWEPRGDLIVRSSRLKNIIIEGEDVVKSIDEIPVIAVAGVFGKGKLVVRDAGELRVKETDRIRAIVENMKKFGVEVEEFNDGFSIQGGTLSPPREVEVDPMGDHRIAMAFAIMGHALRDSVVTIKDFEVVDISFPSFREKLDGLF